MKKLFYFLSFFLLSSSTLQAQTIADIAATNPNFSTLNAALQAAELDGALAGEGPFTVFAPTDAAFANLPANLVNALLTDPQGVLTEILTYHVVAGEAPAASLSNGQMVATLNGQSVVISISGDEVFVDNAQVTGPDVMASNGIIHIIDAVLIPTTTTIADVVAGSDVHETLLTALQEANLDGVLAGPGAFTVFAPTDAAFQLLPDGLLPQLLAEPAGLLTDILLYHVVDGIALSTDLSDGQMITTLFGDDVVVTINGDGDVFINDAQVILADIVTINGVVHVIDAVLVPASDEATILEIVAGSEVHTTLAAAVVAAGLDGVLDGPGNFTVFAPTDEAFAALPDNFVNALLTDPTGVLSHILLYHVIDEEAFAADLFNGQTITTLFDDQDVTVSVSPDGVFINNAKVTVADVVASNGVIHIIDAVLVPNTTTIADVLVASDVHTSLLQAVSLAGLVETLSGPGAFTVFAPTDAAFAALPDGLFEALAADPEGDLTSILLYHVVDAIALSSDLTNGQLIPTIFGETVEVAINGDVVTINGAEVIVADIVTVNGVVHVIDVVLVPSTLSADESTLVRAVNVYPNPADQRVSVALESEMGGRMVVNVMNVMGQMVKTYDLGYANPGYSQNYLDVSDLSTGYYLLSISLGQERIVQKLQVTK